MDDVCCAVKPEDVLPFFRHINSIHSSIQFTREGEDLSCRLPFLDVLMQREENGTISTTVYRKPTHTDCYLDFASHHPIVHKAAVVRTPFSRAATVSFCAVLLRDEHAYIKHTLGANHYPMPFVRSYCHSYSGPQQNTSPLRWSVVILYVRGLSEGIERILSSADVRVVFQPHSSLRQELVYPKDPEPTLQKANVVYRIPCTSCSSVYVGQMNRTLEARLKEHKATVKHARTSLSAVADHV